VLAAAVLRFEAGRNVSAVYTYGQPRVGDQQFSSAYDTALGHVTFRFVNDLDIVPHVPPVRLPGAPGQVIQASTADVTPTLDDAPSGIREALISVVSGHVFAHVGQLKLFLRDGSLTDDKLAWHQRELIYSGTFSELLRDYSALAQGGLNSLLRSQDRILDHDPVRGYLAKLEALLKSL
jgi:hypothetical protein